MIQTKKFFRPKIWPSEDGDGGRVGKKLKTNKYLGTGVIQSERTKSAIINLNNKVN